MGRADILVIGGGPAGLGAAIAARLRGFTVTLADPAVPPIDKACGEGLLPAGVGALQRLGVRISATDGFPLQGIRFVSDAVRVQANFFPACGFGVRRTRLHEILVDRASAVGVRMLWGARTAPSVALGSARWIIGADGQNSQVRRAASLDGATRVSFRYGFRRHFRLAPWTDFVEVHWGRRCQIYVTPIGPGEVGVAVLSRDRRLRLDQALIEFPELQKRLSCAGPSGSGAERGGVTIMRRLHRVSRGRTVLVGDASGSVDAITGDGLSLSFLQALAAAEALSAGDLNGYEIAHRRLARRPALAAGALLWLDRSATLRRCVFGVLHFRPGIFTGLAGCVADHPDRGPRSPDPQLRRVARMIAICKEILKSSPR